MKFATDLNKLNYLKGALKAITNMSNFLVPPNYKEVVKMIEVVLKDIDEN